MNIFIHCVIVYGHTGVGVKRMGTKSTPKIPAKAELQLSQREVKLQMARSCATPVVHKPNI